MCITGKFKVQSTVLPRRVLPIKKSGANLALGLIEDSLARRVRPRYSIAPAPAPSPDPAHSSPAEDPPFLFVFF